LHCTPVGNWLHSLEKIWWWLWVGNELTVQKLSL
jgi:hypothetical protein